MESSTTIKRILAGNIIFVPDYQRAYSWDTPEDDKSSKTQTDLFLLDLEEYINSSSKAPYYLGHFIFEDHKNSKYGVIDGQQRLTTIIIFVSALYKRVRDLRELTEDEIELYEDLIKRNSTYRFVTVSYDEMFFKDYIIDRCKSNIESFDTESARRIKKAFEYFCEKLATKSEDELKKLLHVISESFCTTHLIHEESEAIQMFIFQNDRGKKPSDLEIIKAMFMHYIHLNGGDDVDYLLKLIKERFKTIYKMLSHIEYKLSEDNILLYSLQVYFDSLYIDGALSTVKEIIKGKKKIEESLIDFIKSFTNTLESCSINLKEFFGRDERKYDEIHSLITLGSLSIALPFIIKAYNWGLSKKELCELSRGFESLMLRHKVIGTRANLKKRVNWLFKKFTEDNKCIKEIIDHIESLKTTTDWWWAYWNNTEFEKSLLDDFKNNIVRYILWKYENHLESEGKKGYKLTRFDKILRPEVEHIAPQTPDDEPVAAGYCEYDSTFKNEYMNCLGNLLLISKSHNCSIGNESFSKKLESYKHLEQQREIKLFCEEKEVWDIELIEKRRDKIIDFIIEKF